MRGMMTKIQCEKNVDFLTKVMIVFSLPAAIFDLQMNKMSVVDVKKISDDDLMAKLNELIDINDYLDGCGNC